jgi:D-alanyl-D-alanine carboxypeptidase
MFAEDYPINEDKSVKIIGVLLGSSSGSKLFSEVNKLLASVEPGFGNILVAKKDQAVGSYLTEWGTKTEAVIASDLTLVGWKGKARKLNVDLINITPPETAATIVGAVAMEGSDYRVDTILSKSIFEPSVAWKLQNVF